MWLKLLKKVKLLASESMFFVKEELIYVWKT